MSDVPSQFDPPRKKATKGHAQLFQGSPGSREGTQALVRLLGRPTQVMDPFLALP